MRCFQKCVWLDDVVAKLVGCHYRSGPDQKTKQNKQTNNQTKHTHKKYETLIIIDRELEKIEQNKTKQDKNKNKKQKTKQKKNKQKTKQNKTKKRNHNDMAKRK